MPLAHLNLCTMSALIHSSQSPLHTDALAAVKYHAEALELPPCPFCGGVAQVGLGSINCMSYVLIRCSKCGSSTKPISAGPHEPQENDNPQLWGANVRTAITAAAARWSRRP